MTTTKSTLEDRVRALADEWQADYDRWSRVHDGPRVSIFLAHANRLRALLPEHAEKPPRIPYKDIPLVARSILDEVYDQEGVEIFWNAQNKVLDGKRPAECPLADVVALANRLADGNFA